MLGGGSEGIVGGGGQRELEVAKGRLVERSPVGSHRGTGRRDLGQERGVVDIVKFGGWTERRRVTGTICNDFSYLSWSSFP